MGETPLNAIGSFGAKIGNTQSQISFTGDTKNFGGTPIAEAEPEESLPSTRESSTVTSPPSMKVYLRLKPPSWKSRRRTEREEEQEAYTITGPTTLQTKLPPFDANTRLSKKPKVNETVTRRFIFTKTFGPESSQEQLFDQAVKQQMMDFLAGFSSTVMSYGTTNAGKSFTLLGSASAPGLVPRGIELLFSSVECAPVPWYKPIRHNSAIPLDQSEGLLENKLREELLSSIGIDRNRCEAAYESLEASSRGELERSRRDDAMYSVWISYVKICNDTVYDLLAHDCQGNDASLKLVADKSGRIYLKGLRMVCVTSGTDAYQILTAGQIRSNVSGVGLNRKSNRSHAIFTIKLLKYRKECCPDEVEVSTITFCDLVGAGRLKEVTNDGQRSKETQSINASLLVLGRCLKTVWESQQAKHNMEIGASFRESKLTRLFQRPLSGKESLSLFVNVDTDPTLYVDTLSVLNFAAIAKKIILEPEVEVKKLNFHGINFPGSRTTIDGNSSTISSAKRTAKKIDTCETGDHEALKEENEKLKKEVANLRSSALNREYEVREELANFYLLKMKELETSWRTHTKEVDEQREDLLQWSIRQVHSFYKERMDNMGNRKRRRTGGEDAEEDDLSALEELEMENARITSKVVTLRETIKSLREDGRRLCAEKNECVFELVIVKEELKDLKRLIRQALSDGSNIEKDISAMEELKMLIRGKEDCIESLKRRLSKTKDEYFTVSATATKMEKEALEMRVALMKNSEKIKDLEEQLERANTSLSEKSSYIETLENELEIYRYQPTGADRKTQDTEDKRRKAQGRTFVLSRSPDKRVEAIDSEAEEVDMENDAKLSDAMKASLKISDKVKFFPEMLSDTRSKFSAAEADNSPPEDRSKMSEKALLHSNRLRLTEFQYDTIDYIIKRDQESEISGIDTPDVSQTYFKCDDSGKDDSGIAVTSDTSHSRVVSSTGTTESIRFEMDDRACQTTFDDHEKSINIRERVGQLKEDYMSLQTENVRESLKFLELSEELQNIKYAMCLLRETLNNNDVKFVEYESALASKEGELKRLTEEKTKAEEKFDEISKILKAKTREHEKWMADMKNRMKLCEENETRTSMSLEVYLEKSTSLENQLSVAYDQLQKTSVKCFMEHVPQIDKLEKELYSRMQTIRELERKIAETEGSLARVLELNERVNEFEGTLEECQREKKELREQLLEKSGRQSRLEADLKELTVRFRRRDDEVSSLRKEVMEISGTQATNGECMKNLNQVIANSLKKLETLKDDQMQLKEDRRKVQKTSMQEVESLQKYLKIFEKNASLISAPRQSEEWSKQDELNDLKLRLCEREWEMSVFKKNRDRTIEKYESLVNQLRRDVRASRQDPEERNRGELPNITNVEEEDEESKKISQFSENKENSEISCSEKCDDSNFLQSIATGTSYLKTLPIDETPSLKMEEIFVGMELNRQAGSKSNLGSGTTNSPTPSGNNISVVPSILSVTDDSTSEFRSASESFDLVTEVEISKFLNQQEQKCHSEPSITVTPVRFHTTDDSDDEFQKSSRWLEVLRPNLKPKILMQQDQISIDVEPDECYTPENRTMSPDSLESPS